MKPLREMLSFNLMMVFYLNGNLVARHGWDQPIDYNSGYLFTADDQTAKDWMVVVVEAEEEND